MAKQAVLLLAHGTPETVEQIPEYLRNVVSGRPMPQQVVEEIQHRYSLIGRSPLTELTMEQARLTETELAANEVPVRVYVGMRNWRPYIPDVVNQMRADGVEEAAAICLAPQNSRTSCGPLPEGGDGGGARAARGLYRCVGAASVADRGIRGAAAAGAAQADGGSWASCAGAVYGAQRAGAHGSADRKLQRAARSCGRARAQIPTPKRRATPRN